LVSVEGLAPVACVRSIASKAVDVPSPNPRSGGRFAITAARPASRAPRGGDMPALHKGTSACAEIELRKLCLKSALFRACGFPLPRPVPASRAG
jgi:hypothetical protein